MDDQIVTPAEVTQEPVVEETPVVEPTLSEDNLEVPVEPIVPPTEIKTEEQLAQEHPDIPLVETPVEPLEAPIEVVETPAEVIEVEEPVVEAPLNEFQVFLKQTAEEAAQLEDRSAFDCSECFGQGLKTPVTVCPTCHGTGKVSNGN